MEAQAPQAIIQEGGIYSWKPAQLAMSAFWLKIQKYVP
jgi:hypothetical protein